MNKTEMIDAIAAETELTKVDVTKVLNALVEKTVEVVAAGGEFTIIGFGSFKSSVRKAREGRNPSTGAVIKIAEATVPKFVAGKKFKDAVNAPKKPAKRGARKAKK